MGHTGTLDPLATGLMLLVLGEATKISDYLTAEDKRYLVDIQLGVESDTLDRDGKVSPCSDRRVEESEIREACEGLLGEFEWPVPHYSAVKVGGKPLHISARRGEETETPTRPMSFWDLRYVSWDAPSQRLQVEISCTKGSYIRTWVQQLGQALKVGGIVQELRRLSIGNWAIAEAVSLPQLQEMGQEALDSVLRPLNACLPGLRTLVADGREARLVQNGQIPRDFMARLVPEQKQAFTSQNPVVVKVVSGSGGLLALISAQQGQGLKIKRVFRSFP